MPDHGMLTVTFEGGGCAVHPVSPIENPDVQDAFGAWVHFQTVDGWVMYPSDRVVEVVYVRYPDTGAR